jgi:hypothetical protein
MFLEGDFVVNGIAAQSSLSFRSNEASIMFCPSACDNRAAPIIRCRASHAERIRRFLVTYVGSRSDFFPLGVFGFPPDDVFLI